MGLLDPPAAAPVDVIRSANALRGLNSVANRCSIANTWTSTTTVNQSDGTATVETSRTTHMMTCDVSGLRLVYCNLANGVRLGNAITVTAELYHPTYGYFPASFNGQASITIEPGGMAVSDPIAVEMTQGTVFSARQCVSVATLGQKWPTNVAIVSGQQDGTWASNYTRTYNNTGQTYTAGKRLFSPSAIIGKPLNQTKPPLAAIGDSIISGYTDSETGYPTTPTGWLARKLANTRSYLNLSVSGSSASDLARVNTDGPRSNHTAELWDSCQRVIYELGRNDITNGASLATLQASTLAYWKGMRTRIPVDIAACTILPKSTSTDSWATTTNQTTEAANSIRTGYNAWLRDGSPINSSAYTAAAVGASGSGIIRAGDSGHPLWIQSGHATLGKGYIEVADLGETARDTGIWKAGYTGDGTHPNSTGYAAIASAVDLGNF